MTHPTDDSDELEYETVSGNTKSNAYIQLSREELAAREAWVLAVRDYHKRRTGKECTYNSSPRWDGGLCPKTGKKYKKPIWTKVVAIAKAAGVTPADLAKMAFVGHTSDNAPSPYTLLAEEVIEMARKRKLTAGRRVLDALRADECNFKSGVWGVNRTIPDPVAAERYVLNDMGRDLSPLFRYCVAGIRGYTDVADRWRTAAANQFEADRAAYLMYWESLLPRDMGKV